MSQLGLEDVLTRPDRDLPDRMLFLEEAPLPLDLHGPRHGGEQLGAEHLEVDRDVGGVQVEGGGDAVEVGVRRRGVGHRVSEYTNGPGGQGAAGLRGPTPYRLQPMELDRSHDPERRSWVASARILGTDRPLQNLPLCAFRAAGTDTPTSIGVGIGDEVLDVGAAVHEGLLRLETATAAACRQPTLDEVMALDAGARRELRLAVSDLLAEGVSPAIRERAPARLFPIRECVLSLPCTIGDYTDFYASIFHATNLGRQLRPESPLLPNYRWMPIAYHGRASSIVASGTPVVRPRGQTRPEADSPPVFGPTRRLDYEVELGFYVGPGNPRGEQIHMGRAAEHLVGACLLNDWSARDIQAWEYQPLGPFLGKSFATTVSPWVVTMEALAPFRVPARAGRPEDPIPLPHLHDPSDQAEGGVDVVLEVAITTVQMR